MPTLNGRSYTGVGGLNLRSINGAIRFETPDITPTTTSGERLLYVNSSNELVYNNGSGTVVLGAGGGGSTPSWETIFGSDMTFTLTPDTAFTIAGNRATATDVFVISNTGGGSGACLAFNNSGSGADVDGTGDTWTVSKAGAATFLTLTLSGTTITSTADNIAWALKDNSATALSIGASGDTNMMVFDTSNAAPIVKFNDSMQVVDGNATFISTSNTVTNVLVTNNTITTFGADANSAGAVVIRSTSLTTGSLLKLQLGDDNLAGGFYLCCRESVGGTNDFTIGENGVIVMAGTAGADSFTMTAGDAVLSDGSVAITDADNAATFSVTNNTATTASVIVIAGSGVFTGSTTTSFMTITPSGLTTGTAVYLPCAGLTTGKALHIVANAATTTAGLITVSATGMTDGFISAFTGGGANITASGGLANWSMGAATVGNGLKIATTGVYTGTGLITLTANSATTGVIQQITANGLTTGTGLSISSSGTIATTGELLDLVGNSATTCTGLLRISGTALTDGYCLEATGGGANFTATGGMFNLDMGAATVGAGIKIATSGVYTGAGLLQLTLNSATTGVGAVITANGLTTGTALTLTSSGTLVTTGEMLNIVANSATTATALLRISGTGLTDGYVVEFTGGGANFTATGGIANWSMGAATVGAGLKIATTGVYTGAGLIQLTANSATTGVIAQITANGLTTGNALNVSSSGTVTSSGTGIVAITGSGVTTGYICQITDGGASNTMTSGNVLRLYTNSNDTTARGVLSIVQDHASASGATPILIQQDGVVSTNYRRLIKESATGITIWMGNGTTANGTLSGTAGDILINGGSNKPEYCTGTTNWTALV